jgi:DNA-directed RNA polymerases I, II, and III subunit RPABC1
MTSVSQSISSLSPEAARLFRVRKTCLKMLRKRGYLIDDHDFDMTGDQFKQKLDEQSEHGLWRISASKSDDPADKIFVFFPEEEKVGVKPIKTYSQLMKSEGVTNAIMVVKINLTPFAKTAVKELTQRGFRIEHFREAELLVDITEHKLVPEHVVLTEQQKKELLERYKLKEFQLPRIQVTDPVARYFGLKHRQVVKIIRPSETAGRYVTYRICV